MSLDELDVKIIDVLQKDASLSYSDLARQLGQNESTIRKRVLTLRERGVIKKFTIIVDNLKVGYNTIAVVGFDVDPGMLLETAQKLAEFEEVRYVATSTGDHMIMAEIWGKDGRDLAQTLSKISSVQGIKRICPSILLEKIKE
ncbi:MAG: winged helix-turn-helix transcriptional regulator [Candidatus Methanosuratincola sp.]|jgi:Lrp/AsnC family transcriptional regulator for asnA, asnC and gidA|nr:Lrp/AsnC family transcriptional regulator [Candidatus Methanosuratincola sp.]